MFDLLAAEAWIRRFLEPAAAIEVAHEQPWATVLRVPLANGSAWFKACAPLQAFESRLTAELATRWRDRVPRVVAYDDGRFWLLMADAGTAISSLGNPPRAWMAALPCYAELQIGEIAYATDHLAHCVPDLRLETLPSRYEDLIRLELPLGPEDVRRLQDFAAPFGQLCDQLATAGISETIQHDDLHHTNLYIDGPLARVLDWGDASVAHPFFSLVVTFRFLEEQNNTNAANAFEDSPG